MGLRAMQPPRNTPPQERWTGPPRDRTSPPRAWQVGALGSAAPGTVEPYTINTPSTLNKPSPINKPSTLKSHGTGPPQKRWTTGPPREGHPPKKWTRHPPACERAQARTMRSPRLKRWPRRCWSKPLHPTPHTLHPTPHTLNPQPSTLNPQPSTLNPQPSTLNPQPSTPNPKPQTPNSTSGAGALGGGEARRG